MVDAIAQNDIINSVRIERVGKEAEAFDGVAAFNSFESERLEKIAAERLAQAEALKEITQGFDVTESGLYYRIDVNGVGETPQKGATVSVHYKGELLDGTVFDSSYKRNSPIEFSLGVGQVIPGWDEGIALLNKGAKATLIIPSDLAYGAAGAGGVIPPNATLKFTVELVDFS